MTPSPSPPHPGTDIRMARDAHGWTQAELAEHSGVGVRTVRRVEAGAVTPDTRTLARLRRALGLPVDDIPSGSRAELIAWALDAANDLDFIAAIARRFNRAQPPDLPDHDLYLPRDETENNSENGTNRQSGSG